MHESPEPRQHYLDVRRGGKVPRSTRRRKADLASERIIPRMTGNLEVMSSSVGLIPRNALVSIKWSSSWIVGNSYLGISSGLPVTRELFGDLMPCTLLTQRRRYFEGRGDSCRLWAAILIPASVLSKKSAMLSRSA